MHYRSPGVFSLGGWAPRLPTGFHVSRGTQAPTQPSRTFRLRGSHPLWPRVPPGSPRWQLSRERTGVRSGRAFNPTPTTPPGLTWVWFGLRRVRSPLLAASRLISVPRGTKMFQFPRFASNRPIDSGDGAIPHQDSGLPHSEIPGSKPAYGSPRQYRCSPRPSSAPGAKASTVCPS